MSSAESRHAHIECPDPSVHEDARRHDRLSAQASTAALLATKPHKGTDREAKQEDVLGSDGKLSSKSAATSLKYAKATDLPSFPSHGLSGDSDAAGAAAMLAKDYKMKDLWQPEQSMAGSKAAVKAQKDGGKVDLWHYEGSKNGLSAAALAMKKNTQTPLSPNIDRGYTTAGKNNSLLAATQSARASRQRAGSTPIRPPLLYPDEKNSARNALSAATMSHRNSVRVPPAKKEEGWNSEANQAARIQNSHMDREMFGSSPPVEPELEERRHNEALRASAVSMAKKMYDHQKLAAASDNSSIGSAGAETAHRRNASNISQPDLKQEAKNYITLQDQAHKLAQERLAKVDKDMEGNKYREYYGYGGKSPRKSRLSVRGRNRGRAASEGGADSDDSDDEQQARRIRNQMSQLSTASNTVSDKQRDEDRARLLKAAEKRVHDRMHVMDEKVFMDTGKPSQAMMDDWEAKARAKAEQNRSERERHPGKTHIGGGKYMDKSEIEAIALARLKPTLDELNENATKRREHDEEMARQRDAHQTARMEEKIRDDHQKAEFRRIKDHDKATARKEKEDRKAAQRQEKVRKSEDQRKSREMKRPEPTAIITTGGDENAVDDREQAEEPQQDVKEKRKSRGVFGRLTGKFRKDEKPTTQSEKTEPTAAARTSGATETEVSETSGAPVVGVLGSSGAAADDDDNDSLYKLSTREAEGARDVESRSDYQSTRDPRSTSIDRESEPRSKELTYLGAAAAAAGGTTAAGGLAWATSNSRPADERDDVSSISSRDSLQRVETAHSVQPLQSPGVSNRPDLDRHISTINTSSGESDSDELWDSDDDEDDRGRGGGQGQGQGTYFTSSRSEPEPVTEEFVTPAHEPEQPSTTEDSHAGRDAALGAGAAGAAGAAAYAFGSQNNDSSQVQSVVSPETLAYRGAKPLDNETGNDAQPSVTGQSPLSRDADTTASVGGPPAHATGDFNNESNHVESVVSPETLAYHKAKPLDNQSGQPSDTRQPERDAGRAAEGGTYALGSHNNDSAQVHSVVSPETLAYRGSHPLDNTTSSSIEPKASTGAAGLTNSANEPAAATSRGPADTSGREAAVQPVQGEREHEPVRELSSGIPKDETPSTEARKQAEPERKVLRKQDPAAGPSTADSKVLRKQDPAAQAPAVATGPSASESKAQGKPKEEKEEKRGLRGLFSRFTGREHDSKSDGKLHKSRSPEQGFQGGAKFTSPSASASSPSQDEADSTITPVTTTSAGREAGGAGSTPLTGTASDNQTQPPRISTGTDEPVGRPSITSESSFKRHNLDPHNNLDDLSSSGAEEDDVVRRGRESEEFQEARDQFDESLAPPPAFAGQKSQSPVRETRFTERF